MERGGCGGNEGGVKDVLHCLPFTVYILQLCYVWEKDVKWKWSWVDCDGVGLGFSRAKRDFYNGNLECAESGGGINSMTLH